MSDTVVMVLSAVIALAVLGGGVWGIWHIARRTPTRQRALTHVLIITVGVLLLGVVLPAGLMGILDPFPIWLVYVALVAGNATMLGWRWRVLESGQGHHPGLIATACVLLVVFIMAGFAVT